MKFTLTYDGPLATNPRPTQKHDIRRALHPQLSELRQQRPIAQNIGAVPSVTVDGYAFTALVHPHWHFRAELDILMLRSEPPGGLLVAGGDIDNRMKTLFDALARPVHAQDIPKGWTPTADENPLHCLLEDDSLIMSVAVKTDRLLAADTPSHVKLIIGVQVQTAMNFGGLALMV